MVLKSSSRLVSFLILIQVATSCRRDPFYDPVYFEPMPSDKIELGLKRLRLGENETITFSKWPQTTLRRVKEDWIRRTPWNSHTPNGNRFYAGYDGLLLSTCRHVPMFDNCASFTLNSRKSERKKIDFRTFYGTPKIYTEWSTYDRFDVLDCSDTTDKWRFFTGEECVEVSCQISHSCDDIMCHCCEDLRCLRPQSEISLHDISSNGTIRVKNCTNINMFDNDLSRRCSGVCGRIDKAMLERYLNVSCGFVSCQQRIQSCSEMNCLCCDVLTCIPIEMSDRSLAYGYLSSDDRNLLHLSGYLSNNLRVYSPENAIPKLDRPSNNRTPPLVVPSIPRYPFYFGSSHSGFSHKPLSFGFLIFVGYCVSLL